MKNKGFTLVELLAVLIVLSVVMAIVVVSISTLLSNSEKSLSETQKKEIENAAKIYYLNEGMNTDATCVSVEYLINQGYLDGDKVVDPETKADLDGYVKITYASNKYSYKYQEESCE